MSEKTEKATPYKLKKAKDRGQANKSADAVTFFYLLIMLGLIASLWPRLLIEFKQLLRHLLSLAANLHPNASNLGDLNQWLIPHMINLWLPIALAGLLTLILTNIVQTGFVWSTKPLTPDFKRLSMTQGFKKVCSGRNCFDALKHTAKLSLALAFLYFTLKNKIPTITQLCLISPNQSIMIIMPMILKTLFQLILIISLLSCIDLVYTRWKYLKEQRMSKQELKEEYKQREGDPQIKAKIKQIQNQLRQKTASLKQIQHADVVVTNPSHIAIALQYDRRLMPSPKVVCKAQDEMARQVKTIARKYGIPIIENKVLARALYQTVELNQWISRALFPMTAEVFREVYRQRKDK